MTINAIRLLVFKIPSHPYLHDSTDATVEKKISRLFRRKMEGERLISRFGLWSCRH